MRHIFRAMSAVWRIGGPSTPATDGNLERLDNGIINASRRASSATMEALRLQGNGSAYTLPPEGELERQLTAYFDNTGCLFPFIHPLSFLETYEQVKSSGFTTVRRTWLGLLNMILAIATNTNYDEHVSALQRISKSEVFYDRAVSLSKTQMLRGTNIEIGRVRKLC